ncbi:hypothetical protein ACWEV3_01130 [Saccharopolyspora sp. NPDC003752]
MESNAQVPRPPKARWAAEIGVWFAARRAARCGADPVRAAVDASLERAAADGHRRVGLWLAERSAPLHSELSTVRADLEACPQPPSDRPPLPAKPTETGDWVGWSDRYREAIEHRAEHDRLAAQRRELQQRAHRIAQDLDALRMIAERACEAFTARAEVLKQRVATAVASRRPGKNTNPAPMEACPLTNGNGHHAGRGLRPLDSAVSE